MATLPRQHAFGWPDPRTGPWMLTVHTAAVNGRMECVGLSVMSYADSGDVPMGGVPGSDAIVNGEDTVNRVEPVRTSTLRSIPLGDLMSKITQEAIDKGPARIARVPWSDREEERLESAKASTAGRGGRKGHGPEHYAEVARVYSAAWAQGGYPTKAVAEKWTVAKPTAAKWVSRARTLGLREPTSKGRAGGIPTQGDDE